MLVELLLKPSHEKNVLVYAIAGMGGIGKTTLARKIFKHEKIRPSFNEIRPAWVRVSKAYDEMTVLKKIMTAFGGGQDEIQNPDELPSKLRHLVTGKKFFLVLDDVWSIKVWDEVLKPLLHDAGPGSRILITARDTVISRGMDAERCHVVQKLSPEDGWSLLCKMVFRRGDERQKQNLKEIGQRIVDKCDGLPLALKTIGGVLRSRDPIQAEWEKVAVDSAWSFEQQEEIEGIRKRLMTEVLLPSYEDLSSQLKQCFVYCAMLPKDCILRQDVLVPLWIAEGFIKASKDSSKEDTAEGYWKELVRRSLLQPDPGYYDQGGCRMHPVVRSLALYLAQGECYSGDVQGLRENQTADATSSSPKRRRVLIKDEEEVSIPDVMMIQEPTCLRTIIFLDTPLLQQVPEDFFKKFTCLRVLDLSEAPNFKLPDAVQHLIHLRYLNLSRSKISDLPNTIGRLKSLQLLGLAECRRLRILSDAILELRNLRVLDVDGTQLEGMPKGIGKLQHVHRLVGFRVHSSTNYADISGAEGGEGQDGRQRSPANWCTLEELKSLTRLKFLMIQNLERISSIDEAERAELPSKSHLDDLRLICNPAQEAITDERRGKLRRYFGLEYPGWMMGGGISSHLPDLKHLELGDCFFCQTLPPLGLLPHLEILHISGANAVKRIGNEFLLGDAAAAAAGQTRHRFPAFPNLKHLILKNMNSWQKWWWKGEEEDPAPLPLLEELVIERCGKLMSLPKGLLHNVTRLTIEDASKVKEVGNLPSVRTLKIARTGLERIHNLQALENLTIVDCYRLRHMEKIGELQYVKYEDQRVGCLPNWLANEKEGREPQQSLPFDVWNTRSGLQDFVEVRKLEFKCSSWLLRRCIEGGPEWPKIQQIPHVKGYNMDESRYIFYDKSNPDHKFDTNIHEEEITSETTRNSSLRNKRTTKSSSDLASPFSIVILLLLIVGVARLAFDYKSFLLPFLLKAAPAAVQKFKYTRLCGDIYSLYHAWQKQ